MRRIALALLVLAGSASGATWVVSPGGDDAAAGTAEHPFRTIQHAATLAEPGDTVLVGPGIYRERVAPVRGGTPGHPIVYRSAVPHAAALRGSVVWHPAWKCEAEDTWSGILEPALFPDHSQRDGANPFDAPLSSTPGGRDGLPEYERGYPNSDRTLVYTLGQVFVDGARYDQVGREAELGARARTWYYDRAAHRLSIHFPDNNPGAHTVEVTNQRRLFAPHRRQLGYISVEGFVFERCGNQYPTNFWEKAHPEWQQAGEVGTRSGNHWIIRDNIIRDAAGVGVDCGDEGDPDTDLELGDNGRAEHAGYTTIENNWILDNGGAGTASFKGFHLTVVGNVVERNNALRFIGKKRWESAGIKLHDPTGSLIARNLVRDNFGKWGIWLDAGAGEGTRVMGNVVIHQGIGIDYEIGAAAPSLCANNVLIDDAIGIGTRESGGVTISHNLIVDSCVAGVAFSIDRTRRGTWSAAHNYLFKNFLIGGSGLYERLTTRAAPRSDDRRLDDNLYAMRPGEPRFAIENGNPMDLAAWQALWKRYNGPENAEGDSRLVAGIVCRFDPKGLMLDLELPEGWAAPGEELPGPFPRLRAGENRLRLWTGIPEAPSDVRVRAD